MMSFKVQNNRTKQPRMPIKLVRVGPIPQSFTAVPLHSSTATAATLPLILQQVTSVSTSSETMTNAAKGASVQTEHCPIPSPLG